MTIAITSLRYADPAGTLIDMDVSIDGAEPFPFTYAPTDTAPVAEAVRALLAAGSYEIAPYTAPPPATAPVPDISDRQFFQQLAIDGFITTAEALAAVKTGAIPAAIQTLVDGIAVPAEKFSAEMILSGATVFERSHSLTDAIGAAAGKTPAEIDEFFRAAAAL